MIFLGGRGTGYVSLKTTELVYPNGTVTPGPTMPNTVWDHETVALHDGRFMIIGKTFLHPMHLAVSFTTGTPMYVLLHSALQHVIVR